MYLKNCTSDDFAKLTREIDTVIIPVGSVEAHGHHCPLGTDIFSPKVLCKKINEKIGDQVWIAPGIHYGVSFELAAYPGNVTMPSDVMAEYAFWIGKSFKKTGVKNIVFLNGHGGNMTALDLAAEKIVNGCGATVLNVSWWLDFSKDILTICSSQGHAGEDETSCMLAYDETLVQMEKATKNLKKETCKVQYPERGEQFFTDAITGDGTLASKEKGEKVFEIVSDGIIEKIKLLKQRKFFE